MALGGGRDVLIHPKVLPRPSTYAGLRARLGVRRMGSPVDNRSGLIQPPGVPNLMKLRIQRAWQLALAVAPLAAIALVEAAMKRW